MRIGIVGAGRIGGTLARKFCVAGHAVRIANSRGAETLADLARETGASAVAVGEVARAADMVIVAIPQGSIPRLPKDLFAVASKNVIVVDTGNYYPGVREEPIAAIENGMAESRWVSQMLGRPVVKAFNTNLAYSLTTKAKASGLPGRIALPVAGDDARSKKTVIDLIDAVGFDGVDAGTLDESWRQQPGTPACCSDLQTNDLRTALSAADKARAPQLRDLIFQKMGELNEGFTMDDLIAINRSVHGLVIEN
ncbi:NADPH-dependent F420 reductase [Microvirga terricola]|uniref:NAD(P)-binding domain-containing protein n=1 Tax=Microvirga terricola TaxID=2719797 RepID=A0ABX0VFJ5_9HYPH|nr:NAD(P)-binding domain-containing protein [Microvirga terricola]NIX77460.1 NAD(P)-binding domain-containing protein [Microvirga terricola]